MKQYEIPVIFLTAKGDIASKIKGLKDGAEDYIVKPFEMLEVMVRLEKYWNVMALYKNRFKLVMSSLILLVVLLQKWAWKSI